MENVKEYWPARVEAKFPPNIVKDSVKRKVAPATNPINEEEFFCFETSTSIDPTNKTSAIITISLNDMLKGRNTFNKETSSGGNGK